MVQSHGNVEVVLSSDLEDGVDILEIGFVGREGVVVDPGLLTVTFGFVPSPTPISITCAKMTPFCPIQATAQLATVILVIPGNGRSRKRR